MRSLVWRPATLLSWWRWSRHDGRAGVRVAVGDEAAVGRGAPGRRGRSGGHESGAASCTTSVGVAVNTVSVVSRTTTTAVSTPAGLFVRDTPIVTVVPLSASVTSPASTCTATRVTRRGCARRRGAQWRPGGWRRTAAGRGPPRRLTRRATRIGRRSSASRGSPARARPPVAGAARCQSPWAAARRTRPGRGLRWRPTDRSPPPPPPPLTTEKLAVGPQPRGTVVGPLGDRFHVLKCTACRRGRPARAGQQTHAAERGRHQSGKKRPAVRTPSAVALNWGWDTNAIFGHVDPHPRVESACAGSYGHVFSSNPCGLTFRGNEDVFFYSTRSVST